MMGRKDKKPISSEYEIYKASQKKDFIKEKLRKGSNFIRWFMSKSPLMELEVRKSLIIN